MTSLSLSYHFVQNYLLSSRTRSTVSGVSPICVQRRNADARISLHRTKYLWTADKIVGSHTELSSDRPLRVTFLPFNNKPDASGIQIYSVIKLHVSGIFCAHHQEFFLLYFRAKLGR